MRRLFRRGPALDRQEWHPEASADDFVDLCFRIILGRVPTEFERHEHRRGLEAGVLSRPSDFAPFSYDRERLTFMRMDGCALGFRDGTFDVVYSLSSIEHFGGVAGAKAAVREMARVVRPGGLVAIATDWRVDGPPADEVFAPDEVREIIDAPGLHLVQPIDDKVWSRYQIETVDVHANPLKTPHMLLRTADTVFTTVMMFLSRT